MPEHAGRAANVAANGINRGENARLVDGLNRATGALPVAEGAHEQRVSHGRNGTAPRAGKKLALGQMPGSARHADVRVGRCLQCRPCMASAPTTVPKAGSSAQRCGLTSL